MLKEYKTLLPYFKEHWWRYMCGLICLITVDAVQLLIPQYLRRAIDSIAAAQPRTLIAATLAAMLITTLGIATGRFLWRFFIHGASRRIETSLRDRLFSHLMALPADYFHSNAVGDIMARATNDMQAIRQASGMAFVAFVDGVFMSVAILVVMFAQYPRTTLYTLIPLPLLTVLIIIFGSLVGKRFKLVQDLYSGMSSVVQETLQGIRVVQSFVKEDEFAKRFQSAGDKYKAASMNLVKIWGLFFPLISFMAGATSIILIISGGKAVLENRMTAGSLVAMLSYLEMLIWPMLGAGFTVNMLQRGAASLQRINAVLHSPEEPLFRSAAEPLVPPRKPSGDIVFEKLSILYSGAQSPALNSVSFRIPEGRMIGILGRVGSGKSTLIKTLTRIVEAPPETVLWGGVDIGSYALPDVRSVIGCVPQDSFLFSDSIRNNIVFANPDLPQDRFEAVTQICALQKDIRLFAEGWDTIVGEKGLTLSGGQKQRVAIARAIACDPYVLILDDALSAVDTETEELIVQGLFADRKGKTTIIISNRVSTLRHADMLAVLDAGSLVEFGTPDELACKEGLYAEIASLQALSGVAK